MSGGFSPCWYLLACGAAKRLALDGKTSTFKKLIHIDRNVTYAHNQPEITTPKTASGRRIVPLDDRLEEFLKPLGTTGYVLGGESPLTNMVFRRIYKSISGKIELYGATPHVFRHSYVTTLAKAGIDLKTIQRISGHANITIPLKSTNFKDLWQIKGFQI